MPTSPQRPELTPRPRVLPCGYAPRSIHLSCAEGERTLFVGCKDGSIHAAVPRAGETPRYRGAALMETGFETIPIVRQGLPVRALSEWESGWLWVGRLGGAIELIDIRELGRGARSFPRYDVAELVGASPETAGSTEAEAVRSLGWVDRNRRFVSYRNRGTLVMPFVPIAPENPVQALHDAWSSSATLQQVGGAVLPETLLIVPVRHGDGGLFVLANHRGEVFTWDGELRDGVGTVVKIPVWAEHEEPGAVNDVAVLRNDEERRERRHASGVFLATDRGVYLLSFPGPGSSGGAPSFLCRRLALSSLGAVCMAIAYAEPGPTDPGRLGYLWAADSRGNGYLYWSNERENPAQADFRSSGISDLGSQAMLATAWYHDGRLTVGQALRNDQISLNTYEVVERALHPTRWLLSQGYESDLAAADGAASPEAQALANLLKSTAEWPSYARLAEIFEQLAADAERFKILIDFLGEPSPGISWEILDGLHRDDPTDGTARAAVRLWTLSLLGIVNRPPERLSATQREAANLGMIRWLRSLLQRASKVRRQDLVRELEISIQLVRKWGLFGEANSQRKSIVRPLEILRQGGQAEQRLDVLTYEALLLERGIDLLLAERGGHLPGRQGWDVSLIKLQGRTLCAVSWGWGGVELYELSGAPPEVELDLAFDIPVTKNEATGRYEFRAVMYESPRAFQPQRHKAGYSRAVLLGQLNDGATARGYLLTSPTPKANQEPPDIAQLQLWPLDLEGRVRTEQLPQTRNLEAERSVYSLLDLGDGLVLVGLGSETAADLLALAAVSCHDGHWALEFLPLHHDHHQEAIAAGIARERVWSLVRVKEDRVPELGRRVVMGCDSGKIFLLHLTPSTGEPDWHVDWQLVGQMSSRVQALACRPLEGEPRVLRIFAGGSDGSIVTWQEIAAGERGDGRAFTSLWACHEGASITGLHPLEDAVEGVPMPMLLAVTSEERCTFYDDRERTTVAEHKSHPARIPFPGCRHGIFQRSRSEPSTAFASALVAQVPNDPEAGRVATLLTASKHGVIRLLTLHYPCFTDLRRKQFRHVVDGWWQAVQENRQLRLIQAVYRASPSLELILVRWLLDPSVDGEREEPEPWMLPRNLRSLLDVRKAWKSGFAPGVGEHLGRALREAFNLDDLRLFQEICETVLKRSNFKLFATADDDDPTQRQIYAEVYETVERSLRLWRGSSGRQEILARVTVARSLVDGDTLWMILKGAAREKTLAEPAEPPKQHSNRDVLQRRIRGFRELVFSRDSEVSAEALRSANLSLLRTCHRLVSCRPPGGATWTPLGRVPNDEEALWDGIFQPYFETLTSAAVRTFRSRLELNDAMALGYARTFALAVCACPSAAMRIASRMTESQLISDPQSPEDMSQRVLRQFKVLDRSGIPVPHIARELFRIASRPPMNPVEPLADPWLEKELPELREAAHPDQDASIWSKVGYENALQLYCLGRIYRAVEGCSRLEEAFRRSPEKMPEAIQGLPSLSGLDEPDVTRFYGHSASFWRDSFRSLEGILARNGLALDTSRPDILRPETVFLSKEIERWAADTIEDLRRRYQEGRLFQPQFPVYLDALERLRQAAGAFADSAAVRTKVVQGVLGHHMIEDLDEHILELQEIAHVLDPLLVRAYRRSGDPPSSQPEDPIAKRFASYLLERSHRAESLPENLRTLFSMLDRATGARAKPTLRELRAPFTRGELPRPLRFDFDVSEEDLAKELDPEEIRYLRLIFQELGRNNGNHSNTQQSPTVRVPPAAVDFGERLCLVELTFFFPVTDEEVKDFKEYQCQPAAERSLRGNLARLRWLQDHALQVPIEPRPERTVKSSGMGLYLANFAAAIAGWRLTLESVELVDQRGHCRFRLERVSKGAGRETKG